MNNNLIISNLVKSFSGFRLGPIDLKLGQGNVMAIVGQNGAGKTTTLDCISGLIQNYNGEIEICGIKANPNKKDWKYNFGYLMSEPVFISTMNSKEYLIFLSKYYPNWDMVYCKNLTEILELNTDVKISKLSTGNKTKLEIISALSHRPSLLLLDEPTNNLDPIIRDRFMDIMFEFIQTETYSILWSTHLINEVSTIADEFAFISNGKIYEVSKKTDMIENWRKIICSISIEINNIPNIVESTVIDNKLQIISDNYDNTIKYLISNDLEIYESYYLTSEEICIKNLLRYKYEN